MFIEATDRAFGEFVASKDPNETYEWCKADVCACGQFAQKVGQENWMSMANKAVGNWDRWNTIAGLKPHNFGALHERLKEAELV